MSMETIFAFLIGGAALYVLYVITKKIMTSLFLGLFVAGVLFGLVPLLTERDDAFGSAARAVDDVTRTITHRAKSVLTHPNTQQFVEKAKAEVRSLTEGETPLQKEHAGGVESAVREEAE